MDSFSAQEKSTIRMEMARVAFRISRYVSAVPARLYGTSRSARASARSSVVDFSFYDSSIIVTIWS